MTKEKQCAMDKRGTISIKLTPEELKMLKHFLNVALNSIYTYIQDETIGTPEQKVPEQKVPLMLAMMVALRVYREIVAPCVGCDAKKVGEGDVVKKIDIN